MARTLTSATGTFNRNGFTLIELVVVLVILAMVTLLVWPRLPDTRAAALKSSARNMATTIRYLEDQVIATRQPFRLRLSPGTGDVSVTLPQADGTENAPSDPLLSRHPLADGVTIADVQLPRLGTVSTGEVALDFSPAGLTDTVTLHLREAGGGQMTIIAFSYGGRVVVRDGYQEAQL